MKLIQAGVVFVAISILPNTAHAGPIQYSWQVDGHLDPTRSPWSPGLITLPSSGGVVTSSLPNSSTIIATVTLSNWNTNPPSVPPGYFPFGGGDVFPSQSYSVIVSLTDQASHQSGQVTVYGDASNTWQYEDGKWSEVQVIFGGFPFSDAVLTLGKNQYTVSMDEIYSLPTSSGTLVSSISVSVEPAPAPEPATFLLAAAGLPLVGLFYRWRISAAAH